MFADEKMSDEGIISIVITSQKNVPEPYHPLRWDIFSMFFTTSTIRLCAYLFCVLIVYHIHYGTCTILTEDL